MSGEMDEKTEIVVEAMDASSNSEMMIDEKNDMNADVEMKDDSPQSPECDTPFLDPSSPSRRLEMTESPSHSSSPQNPDLDQGLPNEPLNLVTNPSHEVTETESAQSPVHNDSSRSPIRVISDSAESPIHDGVDSAQSPVHVHDIVDSAQSPVHVHDIVDSAQSPVHVHDIVDSAQSPDHDATDSAQSPDHGGVESASAQSPDHGGADSTQSPDHAGMDSAQSPDHGGVDSAQSPVHHSVDSALSPIPETTESAQSPSHDIDTGFPSSSPSHESSDPPGGIFIPSPSPVHVVDSAESPTHEPVAANHEPLEVQEISNSAQSPPHESDFIQSPSRDPEANQSACHESPEIIQRALGGATTDEISETTQSKSMEDSMSSNTREIPEPESMDDDSVEILQSSSQGTQESVQKGSQSDEEMEDGEIEDDEDEDMPVIVKEEIKLPTRSSSSKLETPSAVIASILPESEKSKSSRSKRHGSREKSKDKEKDPKPSKDKENKKEKKKRRHSKDEGHESSEKTRAKRNRKGGDEEDGAIGDEDDYLFVRGASPSNSPEQAASKAKFFEGEVDAFGRRYDEPDAVEFDEDRRRRRSRSPPERRRGGAGNRRPNSGRKEPPKIKSEQICAYYMQGKCQKSHEDCAFSHNAVPPRKMELCKFWMMECCAKKEKCLYLHNDFPCKYYHTGLVCKLALRNQCKFSHKPLNEVTKAVLLKHIETAPKEILGDFPRLNRNGALNLIAKMEAKINRELEQQERDRDDDHRRRTRWEQPTHEDEVKLQSLMEEAGIENYYEEAVGDGPGQSHGRSPPRRHGGPPNHQRRNPNFYGEQDIHDDRDHHHNPNQRPHQNHHQNPNHNSNSNPNFTMLGVNPMLNMPNMGMLPNQLQPMLPGQTPIVHNPALANVLASLQIPSTTIQPPHKPNQELDSDMSLEEGHVSQYQKLGKLKQEQSTSQNNDTTQSRRSPNRESESSTTPPPLVIAQDSGKDKQEEVKNEPPEHLPPMQKELFRRIQEQQLKNEKKLQRESESEDEKADDIGWYSSDEETEKPSASAKSVENADIKPVVDFASVLSAIRQKTAAAQSKELSDSVNGGDTKTELSPPRGRGDVDLRYTTQQNSVGGAGQGPFGDTDFRLPSLRPEFKDIDLRLGSGGSPGVAAEAGRASPVAPVFKSMPTGPATMIDASLNSHPPMVWKVQLAYSRKPDYNYIRHTLTANQMSMDPRFGTRTAGGISILPDPSSPPPVTSNTASPATIPGGDLDPRVRRGQAPQSQQSHVDPRFGRDPRSGVQQAQQQTQQQQNMLPSGWDMTQAAIQQAAQLMAAQQLGLPLLPFPNSTGLPFPTPEFAAAMSGAGNNNASISGRPGFHGQGGQFQGQNQFMGRPPSSSWERMQSGGGVTPPI